MTAPTPRPEWVTVIPQPGTESEVAQQLLDAAGDRQEFDVRTVDGGFEVPADVADAAGLGADTTVVDEKPAPVFGAGNTADSTEVLEGLTVAELQQRAGVKHGTKAELIARIRAASE